MHKIVISDTSILIIFQKIDALYILEKVYGKLITTPEVEKEFGDELPNWITVQQVKDKKYQLFLETQLDIGEASAIALAIELGNSTLLLDDLNARKIAQSLNLKNNWFNWYY